MTASGGFCVMHGYCIETFTPTRGKLEVSRVKLSERGTRRGEGRGGGEEKWSRKKKKRWEKEL